MISIHGCISSFIFFFFFGDKLSNFISQTISMYRTLSTSQKNEWNARNLSSLHAVIVSLLCIYVIIVEDQLQKNLVHGSSRVAEVNIAIAAGYLFADLLPLLIDYRNMKHNVGYIVHHAVSVYAYILAFETGFLLFFANFRLLAEISTPFVNMRWMLSVGNNKTTQLYFYNGCIMTFLFFLSRIFIMPYYYYMVFKVVSTAEYKECVTVPVHISWIGACIILDLLNFLWFYKMISGVRKHFLKSNTPTTPQISRSKQD